MKITKTIKTLVFMVSMVFLAQYAFAATVRISWNSNSESDLDGYKVYYGTSSRSYQQTLDVGLATSVDVPGLAEASAYFFAVTAYDATGNESDYSSEAYIFIPSEDSGALPDADLDGMPDAFELSLGMDPADPSDSLADTDQDGVVNLVEYMAGTSPLDPADRPETDDVLKDVIGEVGEAIDLSIVNPQGSYPIIPLSDLYPEPQDNLLQTDTQGAYLYDVIDDVSALVYRLRVSVTDQLSVLGEYEPGYQMNLEDTSYGISIEIPADAVIRQVPIGIGNMRVEAVSAVEYDSDYFEFDVLPFGLVLAKPALITAPYEGENPAVQYYDEANDTWEDVDGVTSSNGLVSFSSQELGSFRVFSSAEDAAGTQDDSVAAGGGGGGGGGCFISTAGF